MFDGRRKIMVAWGTEHGSPKKGLARIDEQYRGSNEAWRIPSDLEKMRNEG